MRSAAFSFDSSSSSSSFADLVSLQRSTGKRCALRQAREELAEVTTKVHALKEKYDVSVAEKNRLKAEAEQMQLLLDRADKLVSGLAGENERWQTSIKEFEGNLHRCIGDSLVAAAFLSYAGPFDTRYRTTLVSGWQATVKQRQIPFSESFMFFEFCSKPSEIREWRIAGLPADDFSTENGCCVTRSSRWPLAIDPQSQAKKWIHKIYNEKLLVTTPGDVTLLRAVERGITFGFAVLVEDISEEIDPSLEPVLARAIRKIGNRHVLSLGDKELDYSPEFRLLLTTRLANPHYAPEVSTKTCIVNFAVVQEGLEAQLLSTIVANEMPALEKQNAELTIRVAVGKKKLVDLEDEILRLLSETQGSLLESADLVDTLQKSKVTSNDVSCQLREAEDTAAQISTKREEFRCAAIRSSIAYFVLADMSRVDAMYAFSLDAYVDLLLQSMEHSRIGSFSPSAIGGGPASSSSHHKTCSGGSAQQQLNGVERSKQINFHHTLSTYRYTCRGLFERHKLLFSIQLCLRIMIHEKKVPKAEFEFLCFGGAVVDREDHRKNPCVDWLDATTWRNVSELDAIGPFTGLANSFQQAHRDWRMWFGSAKPEASSLPGDWENKLNELQRLCVVRALRLDRFLFAATRFVSVSLGPQYAEPPPFDLKAIYDTSTKKTPLIFILSPGIDPTIQVSLLARDLDKSLDICALGQGQASVAVNYITQSLKRGTWTFLANLHLMISWLPELEKIIEEYCTSPDGSSKAPHPSFRLWLSASPSQHFSIAILQRAVKMTTEPPKGLRANMLQLYNLVSEEHFTRCSAQFHYRRLLFALTWFHSILLERRKFRSMGFNVPYEFNNSDFSICHDLIIVLLDEYPERTPLEALRYIIAEANYGVFLS